MISLGYHLQHISEGDDCNWKQPQLDDIRYIPCAAHGEWDISRNVVYQEMFFVINSQDINKTYE